MKTRDELIQILEGVYSIDTFVQPKLESSYVVDTDESVDWNIREVEKINSHIDALRKSARELFATELHIALEDVFEYIREKLYDPNPNKNVLKYIYDQSFSEVRARVGGAGVGEVFDRIDSYIEFLNVVYELSVAGVEYHK